MIQSEHFSLLGDQGAAWVSHCLRTGGGLGRHLGHQLPIVEGEVVGAGHVDLAGAVPEQTARKARPTVRRRDRELRKAPAPPALPASPAPAGTAAAEFEARAAGTLASAGVLMGLLRELDHATTSATMLLEDPAIERMTSPIVNIEPGGYLVAHETLYYWAFIRGVVSSHHLVEWYTGNSLGSALNCVVLHDIGERALASALGDANWAAIAPQVLCLFHGISEPGAPALPLHDGAMSGRRAVTTTASGTSIGTSHEAIHAGSYRGFTCWVPPCEEAAAAS